MTLKVPDDLLAEPFIGFMCLSMFPDSATSICKVLDLTCQEVESFHNRVFTRQDSKTEFKAESIGWKGLETSTGSGNKTKKSLDFPPSLFGF